MEIDLFSFVIGFIVAGILAGIFIIISFEMRKKRALAFTKRFAIISEGLSSLKALFFRIGNQLRAFKADPNKDPETIEKYLDGIAVICDTVSVGMMPPTEEIALEALEGRGGAVEEKAYEDSKKFRDEIRWLRQQLESAGIEKLHETTARRGEKPKIKLVDH